MLRKQALLIWMCILPVASGCSDQHPIHPTYGELVQRGFYVYVLPAEEWKQRGWSQTISIWSWDRHCKGVDETETFNPISVVYRSRSDQPEMVISIGPWDIAWDRYRPVRYVELKSLWISEWSGVYYENQGIIRLRFQDWLGIPVHVSSRLPITETAQLIHQIQYVGPSLETVTNPWDLSKCPKQQTGR